MRLCWIPFVLAGLLAACDGQDPAPAVVRVDVQGLFRAPGQAGPCVSSAEAIVLTVADADGGTRTQRQPLTLDEAEVTFRVALPPGRASFAVDVWSSNGTPLYSGSAAYDVEDGFEVAVPLVKRAPVLQVCPAPLVLKRTANGSSGEFMVYNRGAGPLAWIAVPPAERCKDEACINFDPRVGVTAAGEATRVFSPGVPAFSGPATIGIDAASGGVRFEVRVE